MKITEIEARCREALTALSRIIVGKDEVLQQMLAGILANGHILIEDYPGLAKTLIARLFGEAFDLSFKRRAGDPGCLVASYHGALAFFLGQVPIDRSVLLRQITIQQIPTSRACWWVETMGFCAAEVAVELLFALSMRANPIRHGSFHRLTNAKR